MKISKHLFVAVILTSGMALVGCRNTSGTIVNTDHITGQSAIIEENGRLAHRVNVVKISYDEVNGLKRVNFALASDRNRRTRIDYRICWFDVNGMEIDSQTKPYRNLILEGRDVVTVTGVANSPAAVSSKLRIRETSQAQ